MKDIFAPTGALREAYDAVDWAATPLGPPDAWPPALRSAFAIMHGTRFPSTLLWGPDLVLLYNEPYVEIIGDKHPQALGARAEDTFPEAWDQIGPMLVDVLESGSSTWLEDALVPLDRRGFLEDCYFTFSYSPVTDSDGQVVGVLDIAAETTAEVLDRRRLDLLGTLSDTLTVIDDPEEVRAAALGLLSAGHPDVEHAAIEASDAPTGAGVVYLPLGTSADASHVLAITVSDRTALDDEYYVFLRLIGLTVRQAVERAESLVEERTYSETLQRSLLTRPPDSSGFDVAVRYLPAADAAQIGGDWYDAFLMPHGALTVSIGDVAGHDHEAAATMAQVRTLMRGIAFTLNGAPAAALQALDRAMSVLSVDTIATALMARLDRRPDGPASVWWSSAGHPPPLLLRPDGEVEPLEAASDLLLGLDPATRRRDHRAELPRGGTLVLYTDGLVERRSLPIDEGIAWLSGLIRDRQDLGAEDLADLIVGARRQAAEDDTALLVVRCPSV